MTVLESQRQTHVRRQTDRQIDGQIDKGLGAERKEDMNEKRNQRKGEKNRRKIPPHSVDNKEMACEDYGLLCITRIISFSSLFFGVRYIAGRVPLLQEYSLFLVLSVPYFRVPFLLTCIPLLFSLYTLFLRFLW